MPNPRAVKEISIHALREEGDHRSLFRSAQKIDFYPRPPRGGRQAYKTDGWVGLAFLSTPSARRATWPAHRGRRQIPISIHALREEGDVARCGDSVGNRRFLSTPSARRATLHRVARFQAHETSIHALRAEGDAGGGVKLQDPKTFLSTPSARRATNIGRHPF